MPFKGFGEVDTRKLEVTRRLITDLAQHKAKLDLDLLARREDEIERRDISNALQQFGTEFSKTKSLEEAANVYSTFGQRVGKYVGSPRQKEAEAMAMNAVKTKYPKQDTSTDIYEMAVQGAAESWKTLPPEEKAKYSGVSDYAIKAYVPSLEAFKKQRPIAQTVREAGKPTYVRDPDSGAWMVRKQEMIGGQPVGLQYWDQATDLNKLEAQAKIAKAKLDVAREKGKVKARMYGYDAWGNRSQLYIWEGPNEQNVLNQMKAERQKHIKQWANTPELQADQRSWWAKLWGTEAPATWEQVEADQATWDKLPPKLQNAYMQRIALDEKIAEFEQQMGGAPTGQPTNKTTTTPSTSGAEPVKFNWKPTKK